MENTECDYSDILSLLSKLPPFQGADDSQPSIESSLLPYWQLDLASNSAALDFSDFHSVSEDGDMDSGSTGIGSAPQSAPQSPKRTTGRPNINPTRFKTELCRPFEENGVCRYGNKCQFAHGAAELRGVSRHPKYKTEMCRTYHTTGLCPYGPRCHFIHNEDEYRLSQISEVKKQEIARQAIKEMAQLHARQQLIQGRVGMVIAQLQQQLIMHNFMLQMKQVKAAQKVAKQLAWSDQQPRSASLDSAGDSPPMTPLCSSPSMFETPSTPVFSVPPPPGFEANFIPSATDINNNRLPIFSQLAGEH